MITCTCSTSQDRYTDGSWARSYSLHVDPDCAIHGPAVTQGAAARAWWRGVNDQWNHRPIGNRLPETHNPFGGAS